jgi:hypothetical protein
VLKASNGRLGYVHARHVGGIVRSSVDLDADNIARDGVVTTSATTTAVERARARRLRGSTT